MSLVEVTKDYRIEVDGKILTLQKLSMQENRKTQEKYELWINEGYYNSWESVIHAIHRRFVTEKVHKRELIKLNELLTILEETKQEVKNLFGGKW